MLLENLWPGAETHMQIITSIFFEISLDQHTEELVCKQDEEDEDIVYRLD